MKVISHRGNIKGPVPEKENRPSYIDCALQLGLDVELDIRYCYGGFWLGHDKPDYQVSPTWILKRKDNLWFHCKDIYSVYELNKLDTSIIKFCHTSDSFILVSNNKIWVHDLRININADCIIPLITENQILVGASLLNEVYGICTDYVYHDRLKIK